MSDASRAPSFARNELQETLIEEVNRLLELAEDSAFADPAGPPRLPMVLIVGAPRSGTTLTLQWLANSGSFGYPSNLISRFYGAPYIGTRIQQLIADPRIDFKGELGDLTTRPGLWESEVGKTRGILQPHEFSYFWRRFFPMDQAERLDGEALATSDIAGFQEALGRLERAWQKPFAAKGILLQYNIADLAKWLPGCVFVYTRRDPLCNIPSLLRAREKVYGTRDRWFSVRPPEYAWLRHEDPFTQVAGQVIFTNKWIEKQLQELPVERSIWVDYEAFCADPRALWTEIRQRFDGLGHALGEYTGPAEFTSTNERYTPGEEAASVIAACERVEQRWSPEGLS